MVLITKLPCANNKTMMVLQPKRARHWLLLQLPQAVRRPLLFRPSQSKILSSEIMTFIPDIHISSYHHISSYIIIYISSSRWYRPALRSTGQFNWASPLYWRRSIWFRIFPFPFNLIHWFTNDLNWFTYDLHLHIFFQFNTVYKDEQGEVVDTR